MQLRHRILSALVAGVCTFSLAGCGAETEPAVSSSAAVQTEALQAQEENSYTPVGSFESSDGRILFTWNVSTGGAQTDLPVLNATAHYLSGSDIQQIATALLGDADYLELGPDSGRQLTKTQIEGRIAALEPYLDAAQRSSALHSVYTEADVQEQLDAYAAAYEAAPEETPYQACDWTLKTESYYNDTNTALMGSGSAGKLKALGVLGEKEYYISATVEESSTYHWNMVSIALGDGSDPILKDIQIAELCQMTEPTQEELDSAAQTAQNALDQMGLGEYTIAQTKAISLTYGETPRYAISVRATQVLVGCPVLLGQSAISNGVEDVSTDSTETGSYPYSYIRFVYNADGELLEFAIEGLVDVETVTSGATACIDMDKLCSAAEESMTALDFDSFDDMAGNTAWVTALENDLQEEELSVSVEINDIQFGLARRDSSVKGVYEYVPAAMFNGTVTYMNRATGEVLAESTGVLALLSTTDGADI